MHLYIEEHADVYKWQYNQLFCWARNGIKICGNFQQHNEFHFNFKKIKFHVMKTEKFTVLIL
jgi:hypothetical protein